MTPERFTLVGYSNPLGRYPAPVVPVGRLGAELVAVYADDDVPSYLTLEDDAQYSDFDATARKSLAGFDPRRHRLFALGEGRVRHYLIEREENFFSELLKRKSFSDGNFFLRLSLARATGDPALIVRELTSCVLWMNKSAPELVGPWYQGQLSSLKDCLPVSTYRTIPRSWRDLHHTLKPGESSSTGGVKAGRAGFEAAYRLFSSAGARILFVVTFLGVGAYLYSGPGVLEASGDWVSILAGVVLTHVLFLYTQFYKDSQGYMLRAARRIWVFLITFFVIEWAIGGLFFYLAGLLLRLRAPGFIIAFIVGVMVALIPTAFEGGLLPSKGATVKSVGSTLTRLLLKLNATLRYNFAWAIESCRQQDIFDCQQPDGWGLGVPPREVGRRLRKLYEFCKYKIAEERRDPSFLRYDVGRSPWDMFYLLVRHVGRKRLREYLKNPISAHCPDWDGRERRRRVGTRHDRDKTGDRHPERSRRYDDAELVKRLKSGQGRGKLLRDPESGRRRDEGQ